MVEPVAWRRAAQGVKRPLARGRWARAALLTLLCLVGCSSGVKPPSAAPLEATQDATHPTAFNTQVKPILSRNCYSCHATFNQRGGLRLDSPSAVLRGGKDGAILVPGHPEQSRIILAIRHEGNPEGYMPPRKKLSDEDIAKMTEWIRSGAAMP